MKTVFLSVPNGLLALSFLRTDFIKFLIEEGFEIVVISPLVLDDNFRGEFESNPQIILHPSAPYEPGSVEQTIIELAQESQIERHLNHSLKIKREIRSLKLKAFPWWKRILRNTFFRVGQALPTKFWLTLEKLFVRDRVYDNLFEKYHPSGIIVGAPGTNFQQETPLIRTAQRRGIPVIAAGMSWDHISAKYKLARKVDFLVVWSKRMRDAFCERTGMDPEQVAIAGVPHWDIYANEQVLLSWEEYCRRIGADASKKLILITTETTRIYNYYVEIIEIVLSAIRNGSLPPSQILVRLHPYNDYSFEKHFANFPEIIIEWPFRKTGLNHSSHLQVDVRKEDQVHLANTLYHADIMVGVSSTLAIEACFFDTPVVNVGFDGYENLPYLSSVLRFYDYIHYCPIIKEQAVKLVQSPDELIEQTKIYLRNPALHRENRKRIVCELAYKVDGQSAKRTADFVLKVLDS